MGLFVTKDQYPGANTNTKRALSQADLDALAVVKLREAAKLAHLKIECPGWKVDAWAHVAIPAKKVAIIIIGSNLTVRSQGFRDAWGKHGWKCFTIPKGSVDRASTEELAKDLLVAIDEVGK